MFRRTLSILILISMTLHCFSRLGGLSYMYEKRNEIAYAIGLIAEIPIAICSSDYDFNKGLVIDHGDDHHPAPKQLTHAQEIILFAPAAALDVKPAFFGLNTRDAAYVNELYYSPPPFPIFHPPAVA